MLDRGSLVVSSLVTKSDQYLSKFHQAVGSFRQLARPSSGDWRSGGKARRSTHLTQAVTGRRGGAFGPETLGHCVVARGGVGLGRLAVDQVGAVKPGRIRCRGEEQRRARAFFRRGQKRFCQPPAEPDDAAGQSPIFVAMTPGCSEAATTRRPASRRASSRVNRMLHSFERPYARKRAPAGRSIQVAKVEARAAMRLRGDIDDARRRRCGADARSRSSSRLVSRNGARWLTAIVSSCPSRIAGIAAR